MSLEAKDTPTKLELSLDSRDPFNVGLTDTQDVFIDLTPFDDAVLEIREGVGGALLVKRSVSDANLAIDVPSKRLKCDPFTVGELPGLKAGLFMADVMIHETAPDLWHRSDPFHVEILAGVTTAP